LQRAQQVRGEDPVGRDTGVEVLVEVGVDARRFHFTQVFRVQAHLGRHDRHHQLHAFGFQGLAHAFDQRVVALQVQLFVDDRVEFFVAVQPLVATEHHARTAFVEQLEVQRRPEVGAQALDRKLSS
jgi:predicted metal-dependent TIM-barrel fold hydrolase